ncbi:hypothetical protein GCM10017744_009840 [Streptomyces antimycoticus]
MLPGFFDCHTHLAYAHATPPGRRGELDPVLVTYDTATRLRQTLDAGVTTVRDLGGLATGYRTAVETGRITGPRVHTAVRIISHTGGHADVRLPDGTDLSGGEMSELADTVDEARLAVRKVLRAGADLVKICATGGMGSPYDQPDDEGLLEEEIRAVVDECRRHGGKPVARTRRGTRASSTPSAAGSPASSTATAWTTGPGDGGGARRLRRPDPLHRLRGHRQGHHGALSLREEGALVRHHQGEHLPRDRAGDPDRARHRRRRLPARPEPDGAQLPRRPGHGPHGRHRGRHPDRRRTPRRRRPARHTGPGRVADLVVCDGDPLKDIGVLGDPANVVCVVQDGHVRKDTKGLLPSATPAGRRP